MCTSTPPTCCRVGRSSSSGATTSTSWCCYDGNKMLKLEALAHEVRKAASDKLVRQTVEWIVATGDRLMYCVP